MLFVLLQVPWHILLGKIPEVSFDLFTELGDGFVD
jgi:hypothetical protein